MLVRVEKHPLGPRLHVGRMRVHHWHSGMVLIAVGAYAIWWDRNDLPGRGRQTRLRSAGQSRLELSARLFDPEIGLTTSNVEDCW